MNPPAVSDRPCVKFVAGLLLLLSLMAQPVKAEAMLQYFNTSWAEITAKMPELAEAGYNSMWLPPPTKASGGLSVGYDLWDPFDLGGKDQRNTVRTRYGTEADLLRLMETAHRFGIRIYFDNIMNHRAFDIPGFNETTPIDIYPGMVPEDFHLRVTEEGFYRKWDNTRDWGSGWQVMNLGLSDLIDIAQEPGDTNLNFGRSEGDTGRKIRFLRHPDNPEYYCFLPNGTYVGFGPNNGITRQMLQDNKDFYSEWVEEYLNRAARWLMDRTKADGLRLDAVKHVRFDFFGATWGADRDRSDYGYNGQIQRQFNITRGFSDPNHRDTLFNTEIPRDDAMLFGEHLGEPPGYGGYIDAGMRLIDNPLRDKLNGVLGNPSSGMQGLDQPGSGSPFGPSVAVMHAQSHDNDYAARRELQHAFYFTREGLGLIYTDGNYHAETLGESGGAFPRHANTSFLGQWGDPRVPNLVYIHNQFARGYQKGLWADGDFVAYERLDKWNNWAFNAAMSDADAATMVIMINDNYASGASRNFTTSFNPGAYLYQYATGPFGSNQVGFYKYASELKDVLVPPGSYFVFSWKNPDQPVALTMPGSTVGPIQILQNGQPTSTLTYTRKDGPDGDPAFNPYGLPDSNTNDYSYSITVPRVTDGTNLSILARADLSAENILLKLDGGINLNSQMGLGPQSGELRDNPPALSNDVNLGYEQPQFVRRIREKFAAANTTRNIIGSPGSESYQVTVGSGGFSVFPGNGINNSDGTAGYIYHDPNNNTADGNTVQFSPAPASAAGQPITIAFKVGWSFSIDEAFVYYTTDGVSWPEGSGGVGVGNTRVARASWFKNGANDGTLATDWWRATIPALPAGGVLRYKIGGFKTLSPSVFPLGPSEVALKTRGETLFQITGFNATTVSYRPFNDYGVTRTGLEEGFHVLRSRAHLQRPGRAAIYNTFTQTFYYDTKRPEGAVVFPAQNENLGSQEYGAVVRTDPSVTEVWVNIQDSDPSNDDAATGVENGNGNRAQAAGGGLSWIRATEVTPSLNINSPFQKEWRFTYSNIPSGGANATINVRLRELSSADRNGFAASDVDGHYTTIQRTVRTSAPVTRMFIAWPQTNGDIVGPGYEMKVYFSKSLADGTTTESLIEQFLIRLQTQRSGETSGGEAQSRSSYRINYNETNDYHALVFTLPNFYNGQPDWQHGIEVTRNVAGAPELRATRLVRAFPTEQAPFISVVTPQEIGSDGRALQTVLPDKANPSAADRTIPVRIATAPSATSVQISFESAPAGFNTATGIVAVPGNPTTDGQNKFWDFNLVNVLPGQYRFTATSRTATNVTSAATRNLSVVFRQVVDIDPNDPDNDDDGLPDINETTAEPWPNARLQNPKPNPETWTNGDVHIVYAFGKSLPNSPDSDGDGLPDGLESGWRVAGSGTNTNADTNQDGVRNFVADLDPPFFNTLDNFGRVPGVNSQSEGGDRGRRLFGSMTDPGNPDTDGDGILDGVEDANRNGWVDGDGASILPTAEPSLTRNWPNGRMDPGENWTETDPSNPDSDGDGLFDGFGEDRNFNGFIDGDTNRNRVWNAGEAWTETDPLKADTDGDGLPDGWEVNNGLDPLDNGTLSFRTGGAGNAANGANGDPDGDGFTNAVELANGTNPNVADTGVPPREGSIRIGPVPTSEQVVRGSVINAKEFTDWTADDLMVLDEYDGDGPNNQGSDTFPGGDGWDSSRDLVAFYFRDGGAQSSGGDGKLYFRVDLADLRASGQNGSDIYVVIDTGNPAVGEYNLPDNIDTGTNMRWEAVVACYGPNNGQVYLDTNRASNSTAIGQDLAAFGVISRGMVSNGFLEAFWSSDLDSVEFSISRQALLDAGWNGLNPNSLNFQVYTTKPGTQNSPTPGPGDLGGRSDIRDSIYDDWIASSFWRDQGNIRGSGSVLRSWFGFGGSNDRGKAAKVILTVQSTQALLPGSIVQEKITNNQGGGWVRPVDAHDAFDVPLTMQITPTLASAMRWAKTDPSRNQFRDGPAFNQRLSGLMNRGKLNLIGSTFAGHAIGYFPDSYNRDNRQLSDRFFNAIYGADASQRVFMAQERLLDGAMLNTIGNAATGLGYTHTFADQMKHIFRWFGRTSALGEAGYRINRINGVNVFVVNDQASDFLFSLTDNGLSTALRNLLNRKARAGEQAQVVSFLKDFDDFQSPGNAANYDRVVRWLASRPWVRITTPDEIAQNRVDLNGDGTGDAWGVVDRGANLSLPKVTKDWVDYATLGNFDNWYNGLGTQREGLLNKRFFIRPSVQLATAFGRVGQSGLANQAWLAVSGLGNSGLQTPLGELARGAFHASTFVTAFHNQGNVNLTKFSTGDFMFPATGNETLASFSKIAQSQARFAAMYARVRTWADSASTTTATAVAQDVDLDGESEFLLFNDRVFAVFEALGGRLTNAWVRDLTTGQVLQVIGNPLSYSGFETEEEGTANASGGSPASFRTSAFKDWAITGSATNYVNALYNVAAAPGGTGWTFTSPDGRVSKTIRLASASTNLTATYALSGGATGAFVRFGLSPNLHDLLLNGQTNLSTDSASGIINVRNTRSGGRVRTFLQVSGGGNSGATINTLATDKDVAAGANFDTINMRNQAQTHQVEISGGTAMTFTLGLQTGATISDENTFESFIGQYFTESDPAGDKLPGADPDGDGLTNEQEWVYGTNPKSRNGNNPLNSGLSGSPASGFTLAFDTVPGRVYRVQTTANMGQTWTTAPNGTITGDGTRKSFIDSTTNGQTKRFYRVQVAFP